MELLKIYDSSKENNCIYLGFKNYNELSEARDIIDNAIIEWSENCLKGFMDTFDFLDDELKPMYQFLIDNNIKSVLDYVFYCLDDSKTEYQIISCDDSIYIDME